MKLTSLGENFFNYFFSPKQRKLKKLHKQKSFDKKLVSSLNKTTIPSPKKFKYLPQILNQSEKRQTKFLLTVIFLSSLFLIGQIYYSLTIAVPKSGGEYTEGLIGFPSFINPILMQSDVDRDLSRLIFSGLMKYDNQNQLVPDLAEGYELSEDQLTYTFYLRNNVLWHDNEAFKADDVIFTIASIQDPAFKSPLSRSFRGIKAEKIDDLTVKITLPEPFAPFLNLMTIGVLPEHLWYSVPPHNADLAELNKRPVGTGVWKFDGFKKDKLGAIKSYQLVRNEKYYNQAEIPFLKNLHFKFYGDFISAIEDLKSKKIDGMAYLPKEYQQELKKYKHINYHQLDQPQYTAIFFNQSKNELLKADYIRQVLALATDKQNIINQAFGSKGRIINEPSLPGIETNPEITTYSYDPEKATQILLDNNWLLESTTTPDGLTQQVMKKKNWFLKIELKTVDQPEYIATAEIIKSNWEQIGIKTNVSIIDKSKIISDIIKPRDYEALLFAQNLGSDPDPFPFWHSSQAEYPGLNLALFKNSQADSLLESARKINNSQDRIDKYLEFQKIVADQLPAIFIHNPTYTYPQSQELKGFDLKSIGTSADRFANISQWYINTNRVFK